MTKTVYESPSTDVFEVQSRGMILSSGEKAQVISGYDWDDDE